MSIKSHTKYISVKLGFGAVFALAAMGAWWHEAPNNLAPGQALIEQKALTPTQWKRFLKRPDVELSVLAWFFATSGTTLTLPSDFNVTSNTIFCIASGAGGVSGGGGVTGIRGGNGGVGGGSGSFVSATNYSLFGAGGTVGIQVGAGDTKFDTSNGFIIAKAASGQSGGTGSTGPIGAVITNGSNGGNGGLGTGPNCCGDATGGGGGGGAGAPGPHGTGAAGGSGTGAGGGGGTGDAGNTAAGADGAQFSTTPATGSGGGGTGGVGSIGSGASAGGGTNGGKYGAGGGGGGGQGLASGFPAGSIGGAGSASPGIIAASYTPIATFPVKGSAAPQATFVAWLPPQPQPITVKNLVPPIAGPVAQNPPFPGSYVLSRSRDIAIAWIPPPPGPYSGAVNAQPYGPNWKSPPNTPSAIITLGLGRSTAPWSTFLSWDAVTWSPKNYDLPHGRAQFWEPTKITPPISGPPPQQPPRLGPIGAFISDNLLPQWIPPQYQPITVRNLNPPQSGPAVPSKANLFNLFNQIVASQNLTWCDFDLYTITLFNGSVLRFTTADFDIIANGATYTSQSVRIDQGASKAQAHWKLGFDVDTWTVVFMPRPTDIITGATFPDKIGSVPWIQAAHAGYLDAADVQVDRAWFSAMPTWPIIPGGAVPTGTRTIFAGKIAAVDCTDLVVVLTINDYRDLFSINMPLHFYSAACRFTLFDSQCNADGTMTRGRFMQSGVVGGGSTQANIIPSGGLPNPGGSGTYTLGIVQMTSGLNNGFMRTVTNWDGTNLKLVTPFPFTINPGDTFTASAGCDLQRTTCTAFGNLVNFGGEPFIPAPETIA